MIVHALPACTSCGQPCPLKVALLAHGHRPDHIRPVFRQPGPAYRRLAKPTEPWIKAMVRPLLARPAARAVEEWQRIGRPPNRNRDEDEAAAGPLRPGEKAERGDISSSA